MFWDPWGGGGTFMQAVTCKVVKTERGGGFTPSVKFIRFTFAGKRMP